MQLQDRSVSVTKDNYGRWFVEVEIDGRRRAPVRCLSKQEADERALQMQGGSNRQGDDQTT